MSIPSGYAEWCEGQGINPHHPEAWAPAAHAAFIRWKLARFRAHWLWLRETGDLDLIRAQQNGRAVLHRMVRQDRDEALAPLARSPWKLCPCHRLGAEGTLPLDEIGYVAWPRGEQAPAREERTARWIATEPWQRGGLRGGVAEALANLESFAPARTEASA